MALSTPAAPTAADLIAEVVGEVSPAVARRWHYNWEFWQRPRQQPLWDKPTEAGLRWRSRAWIAGRGYGKLMPLDTPLPTPTGWTTMGEVSAGDQLLDEQGRPCQVVEATIIELNRPTYGPHLR